jgi:hypothetical protein
MKESDAERLVLKTRNSEISILLRPISQAPPLSLLLTASGFYNDYTRTKLLHAYSAIREVQSLQI